ncbi:MAG: phosphate ABC transporter permease subunit PstC [Verrucomicrobiota bacterium]
MPPDSPDTAPATPGTFLIQKERTRFFGLTLDECIKFFFGGNAVVAVVVLGLITLFLFREGGDFFGQNRDSLRVYRQAGLEYVDIMRQEEQDHTALTRYLFDIRLRAFKQMVADGATTAEANARLTAFDDFSYAYGDAVVPLRGLVSELTEVATAIKTKATVAEDRLTERNQYLAAGMTDEAAAVVVEEIDFAAEVQALTGTLPIYKEEIATFGTELERVVADLPELPVPALQPRLERFRQLTHQYIAGFPANIERLENWDQFKPVPLSRAFTSFIFGHQWLTASFWQDWYGVLPLFVGSLMVSVIALCIAVPLGVGAAIYVNQIASAREQRFIKPFIEFISAIPSVVLGFFGIAVLGQALRALSQMESMSWVPGFPFAERLNALTAGVLLALIAVPTIFTLAEDALNNVPRAFKEASFALGASRLQTILRIIAPASLSGIVSAVLLGLGRVIGETMVVLLCAGNRIAIPDFTEGLTAFMQPVHTMTGIIAQEMGEVVRGSIHYRALFVVGLLLFLIALLINFLAQKIVRKYRISVG